MGAGKLLGVVLAHCQASKYFCEVAREHVLLEVPGLCNCLGPRHCTWRMMELCTHIVNIYTVRQETWMSKNNIECQRVTSWAEGQHDNCSHRFETKFRQFCSGHLSVLLQTHCGVGMGGGDGRWCWRVSLSKARDFCVGEGHCRNIKCWDGHW